MIRFASFRAVKILAATVLIATLAAVTVHHNKERKKRAKCPKTFSFQKKCDKFNFQFDQITAPERESVFFYYPSNTPFVLKEYSHSYLSPVTGLLKIESGTVHGRYGLVTDSEGKLLDESANVLLKYMGSRNKVWHSLNSRKTRLKGTAVVLTSAFSDCYYHWLMDVVPKIKLLEIKKCVPDYFCVPYNLKKYQKDILKNFKIDLEKLIYIKNSSYKFDRVVFPYFPAFVKFDHHAYCYQNHQWCIEFLQQIKPVLSKVKNYSQRIFISRKKAHWRRVINENEVFVALQKLGFVRIFLEDLSIFDQISLMENAQFIVSTHGAGLTNLAFCKPNTSVLEIFPGGAFTTPFEESDEFSLYARISKFRGVNHYYLLGRACKSEFVNSWDLNSSDFYVDISELKTAVHKCFHLAS